MAGFFVAINRHDSWCLPPSASGERGQMGRTLGGPAQGPYRSATLRTSRIAFGPVGAQPCANGSDLRLG